MNTVAHNVIVSSVVMLVGLIGLEPMTSRLSAECSSQLSYRPFLSATICWFQSFLSFFSKDGGDDGNRTHDPLLAGQVLSQLSYTPKGRLRNNPQKLNRETFFRVCSLPISSFGDDK